MNPEHAAPTSNAAARARAERGLQVDRGATAAAGRATRCRATMMSISPGLHAGLVHRLRATPSAARSVHALRFAAMCRCLMPVRSTIHSSVVSMPIAAKSKFVMTVAGTPRPVPAKYATGRFMPILPRRLRSSRRPMCSSMLRLDGAARRP